MQRSRIATWKHRDVSGGSFFPSFSFQAYSVRHYRVIDAGLPLVGEYWFCNLHFILKWVTTSSLHTTGQTVPPGRLRPPCGPPSDWRVLLRRDSHRHLFCANAQIRVVTITILTRYIEKSIVICFVATQNRFLKIVEMITPLHGAKRFVVAARLKKNYVWVLHTLKANRLA